MRRIVAGIDIGTTSTRVVVCELPEHITHTTTPQVVAFGDSKSQGVQHGYINNKYDATKSVKEAILNAERALGTTIKEAYVAIGGLSLASSRVTSPISLVGKNDEGIVTEKHIAIILDNAQQRFLELNRNRKIVHYSILSYQLDGQKVYGHPIGMSGSKLAANIVFVAVLENHYEDLIQVVSDAGISVIDVVPSPIALSYAVLSQNQRKTGCVLADIGSETTSVSVFEEDKLISLKIYAIGSSFITNDLALCLRVSLEDAERMKIGRNDSQYNIASNQTVKSIIDARLKDLIDIIQKHLNEIHKAGSLPAGIFFVGGGSRLSSVADYSKAILMLPTSITKISHISNTRRRFNDNEWFVAYGLCYMPLKAKSGGSGSFKAISKKIKNTIAGLFERLMP